MAQEARGLRKRHLRVSLGFIPPAFQCQAGRERRRCEVATYDSIHWVAINLDREPGCNSGRVRNLAVVGERTGFGASFRRAKHDRYPGRGIWARSAQTGGERVGYTSDSLSGGNRKPSMCTRQGISRSDYLDEAGSDGTGGICHGFLVLIPSTVGRLSQTM